MYDRDTLSNYVLERKLMPKKSVEWQPENGLFNGRRETLSGETADGYGIAVSLQQNDDGVLQCVGVSIEWKDKKSLPSQPINSRYFQTLGFGDLLATAREAYLDVGNFVAEAQESIEVDRILADWKSFGSTQIPDEFYAALAFKYEELVKRGLDNPTAALSDELGVDRPTISSRLVEARARELLTKPTQGKFGGRLTAKGKKALGIGRKNEKGK